MKKSFLLFVSILIIHSLPAQEKKQKTGWNFGGALPTITYDTNLGLQYGALVEFFNYRNGSSYPEYSDHIYAEISRFTKGSGIYRFMFESDHLVPRVNIILDLSYLPDQANHFYGFNGYESVFNKDWMDDETDNTDYRTRMFYRFERNQFRIKTDLYGKLLGDHLKWSTGFAFQNFLISSVDINKLNKGSKTKLPSVDDEPGLFERYQVLGIISQNEANGGWVNTIKAGLTWDSRDNKPNPMKGLWTETGIEAAPSFLGNDWEFARFFITHRQYFTIIKNDLSLVYRIGYQSVISGDIPFFYQSQLITSRLTGATSEGLGGISTLRGVLQNRVIGNGILYGNVELRWKPWYFVLFKQQCYLGVDLFYDLGRVTKKVKLPDNLEESFNLEYPAELFSDYFNPGQETFHQCAGISLMLAINSNFVIAFDLGKSFNKQDGNIGFSSGLNYLF